MTMVFKVKNYDCVEIGTSFHEFVNLKFFKNSKFIKNSVFVFVM